MAGPAELAAPAVLPGAAAVRQVEVHSALTQPALAGTRRWSRARLAGTCRAGRPTTGRPTAD
jgi:hypothetical protein